MNVMLLFYLIPHYVQIVLKKIVYIKQLVCKVFISAYNWL